MSSEQNKSRTPELVHIMGVSKLYKELAQRGVRPTTERIAISQLCAMPPAARTIVIDASQLASHIVFHQTVYGGSYRLFRSIAANLVQAYRDAGFEIVVVVDGALDEPKRATWRKRRLSEVKHMAKLQACVNAYNNAKGTSATRSAEKKSTKALGGGVVSIKSVLLEVFTEIRCRTMMAVGEADKEIAALCINNNYFGVVGEDSDYIAFGVPRMIVPGSVKISGKMVTFTSITIDRVSSALGLPVELFPLYAHQKTAHSASAAQHDITITCDEQAGIARWQRLCGADTARSVPRQDCASRPGTSRRGRRGKQAEHCGRRGGLYGRGMQDRKAAAK